MWVPMHVCVCVGLALQFTMKRVEGITITFILRGDNEGAFARKSVIFKRWNYDEGRVWGGDWELAVQVMATSWPNVRILFAPLYFLLLLLLIYKGDIEIK